MLGRRRQHALGRAAGDLGAPIDVAAGADVARRVDHEAATPTDRRRQHGPDDDPSPSTSGTAASTSVPAGDPAVPSTSSGDDLYPELGSADLDVQSYDVRLRYDVATEVIDGAVTVTTLVSRPLDVIALDASQLTVVAP